MQYKDRVFTDEEIVIDNNDYIYCTFKRCTLRYLGGKLPNFTDFNFTGCKFGFGDASHNTLRWLACMYQEFGVEGRTTVTKIFNGICAGEDLGQVGKV